MYVKRITFVTYIIWDLHSTVFSYSHTVFSSLSTVRVYTVILCIQSIIRYSTGTVVTVVQYSYRGAYNSSLREDPGVFFV